MSQSYTAKLYPEPVIKYGFFHFQILKYVFNIDPDLDLIFKRALQDLNKLVINKLPNCISLYITFFISGSSTSLKYT